MYMYITLSLIYNDFKLTLVGRESTASVCVPLATWCLRGKYQCIATALFVSQFFPSKVQVTQN